MFVATNSRYAEIISQLKILDGDIISAQKSWVLFENSAKLFSKDQKSFVKRIKDSGIGEPFDHLQMVMLHNVVSTLCRMYEAAGNDRICIAQTLKLLNEEYGDVLHVKLSDLSLTREAIFRGDAFQELRKFRNSEIGHKLKQNESATYKYIPHIICSTSDLLEDMFKTCNQRRWYGQATISGIEGRAREFWSLLEKSLSDGKGET